MPSTLQPFLLGTLLSGVLLVTSGSAHAATCRWVGPDGGAWNSAANWASRRVPGTTDSVVIDAKKIVAVPADVTVANLTVGEGAEIKNRGKIRVTALTKSLGLFTGKGVLDVPAGASALYDVTAANLLAKVLGSSPAVVFAPITNKGRIVTKVAQGCRVDFASINNTGSTEVVSDGTVTFKDIHNTRALSINATGVLTLANIDNANGASLQISATRASKLTGAVSGIVGSVTSTLGGVLSGDGLDVSNPSVVHLQSLVNRAGGAVQLVGAKDGRYFKGTSITNEGDLQLSGAQTLLAGNISNLAGSTLTLEGEASVFAADGTAPVLSNAGKILKRAGSDATLSVDWTNSGQVVIEAGTLHVRIPSGKTCKQIEGTTTLESGTLAVEKTTALASSGTFEVAGGVVDGIGTINGNVVNAGGTLKPGHSPGSITINGNFTQTAGGVLDMEVGGKVPGTGYDQILVNGTAYLGGTLNFLRWGSYVPKHGDVYTLFTYYSKVGSFAKFVDKSPVAGLSYNTTLTPTDYEVNCFSSAPSDTTPPVVTIVAPVEGKTVRSLPSASGKSTDLSGIKSVTGLLYRYGNSATRVAAGYWAGGISWTTTATTTNERPATGTTAWTLNLPTLPPGRYTLRVKATDAVGNSATSSTISFWVDSGSSSVRTVSTPVSRDEVSSLTSWERF